MIRLISSSVTRTPCERTGREVPGGMINHVALAQEPLGAGVLDDDAGVELRGDLEGDAAGDVRLDDAGDDIGARGLGGDDHVDAGGARHLGDAGDGALDIRGRGLHEIGQLVDDDHDVVAACPG